MREGSRKYAGFAIPAGLAVFAYLASNLRDQFASQLFNWVEALPLVGPAVAAITAAVIGNALVLSFYALSVWCAYKFGRILREQAPDFILETITTEGYAQRTLNCLVVRNAGNPYGEHLVKVLSIKAAQDGVSAVDEATLPRALKTVARRKSKGSSAFTLRHNERKNVSFCYFDKHDCKTYLDLESGAIGLRQDSAGYFVEIGLYAEKSSEHALLIRTAHGRELVEILSAKQVREIKSRWASL